MQQREELLEAAADVVRTRTKKGPMSRLDLRQTARANVVRNAMRGEPWVHDFREEDLRFKAFEPVPTPSSNAVIIAMRDVSGSMGERQAFLVRSFCFWMLRFLERKYENVQKVFITHHTDAKEVDEHAFFHLGDSGGTKVSSAYELSLKMVRERFPPAKWNVYPFHFSDGDNLNAKDNEFCAGLVRDHFQTGVNSFGYGDIGAATTGLFATAASASLGQSQLMKALTAGVNDPRFMAVSILEAKDVYPALNKFFSPREGGEKRI